MNLKTTLKSVAIATGVVMGGSFIGGTLVQPHGIAYASAHAYAPPANLNEAARDSFVKAQMKADSIADAKAIKQALKEHLDTCTWCKTSKIVQKPMDILIKFLRKV